MDNPNFAYFMIYVTSDIHFGHEKIIQYSNRPFKTTEEMDNHIIQQWNNTVTDQDIIYHLGDFCFNNKWQYYIDRLNGNKHFILGNHDYQDMKALTGVNWYGDYKELKQDGHHFILCHYPFKVWNKKHYGSINLHGHTHGSLPYATNQLDVGVDCFNYTPISLDKAIDRLKQVKMYIKDSNHFS